MVRRRRSRTRSAPLHLAAQGAQQRHPAEPRPPARRAARAIRAGGRAVPRDSRRGAHGRHAAVGARADAAQDAAHPDHDAGVAEHHAHEHARAGNVQRCARGDRRRDSRDRGHEARRAPRAARWSGSRQLAETPPQRIGLSATQRPLDEIARFLAGKRNEEGDSGGPELAPQESPSNIRIVDCGLSSRSRSRFASPVPDLGNVGGSVWPAVTPLVLERIREARTTLVFVNNRAQAEKIAARVNALAEEEIALPYHGSLARERRFMLEQRSRPGSFARSSRRARSSSGSTSDRSISSFSCSHRSASRRDCSALGAPVTPSARRAVACSFRRSATTRWRSWPSSLRCVKATSSRRIVLQNALDVLAQVIVGHGVGGRLARDDLFDSCGAPIRTTA